MRIVQVHKFLYRKAGAERYFFDGAELLQRHGHEVFLWGMNSEGNEQLAMNNEQLENNTVNHESRFKNSESGIRNHESSEKTQIQNLEPRTYNLEPKTYNVSYINFENPKTLRERARCFFRMVYSFEAKKKFKAFVEEVQPDIVHIHNIYHQISPSILDVCTKKKIPVVMSVHDYSLICPNYHLFSQGHSDEGCKGGNYLHDVWNRSVKSGYLGGLACALEMFLHHMLWKIYEKNIAVFLAPSEFVKDKLIEFGLPKDKVVLLRYFLPKIESAPHLKVDESGRMNQEVGSYKDEAGFFNSMIHDSRFMIPYILAYGRLSEEKGFDVLIRAMVHIKDKELQLKIAGSGPEEDRLKRVIQELGLENRVELLGWKKGEELESLQNNALCIVVPSLWHDPSPFVLLESLAQGKVVIGARVGGITENLEKVDPELLYNSQEVVELAKKIDMVCNYSSDRVKDLKEKGISHIQKEYDSLEHYAKLIKIYSFCKSKGIRKSFPLPSSNSKK